MDENAKLIESILERSAEYGKTTFELAKLKALDKATDVVSSLFPNSIVFALIVIFIFFLNFGLALWLGDILGKIFYGFFVVAAFYGILGIALHLFMHKWLKKVAGNFFIKQVLK
jgi:fatty acid desaturase